MADQKKTINRIFMVPTLIPSNQWNEWKKFLDDNGFLNAYAKDEMKDIQYEDSVYLLFRPKDVDKFREFLDAEYERTKDIIEDYDYSHNFVVVVYKLNSKFKQDFDLVRRSRYSLTSSEFQSLFLKVMKIEIAGLRRDELSLQIRIFKKTEDLKKFWEDKLGDALPDNVEVWEGYHDKNEILTEEKLNQYMEAITT